MTISLINKLPMTLNLQPYLIGFFIRQPQPRSNLNCQLSLLLLIDLSLMYNYTKGDIWLKQRSKRLADAACRVVARTTERGSRKGGGRPLPPPGDEAQPPYSQGHTQPVPNFFKERQAFLVILF